MYSLLVTVLLLASAANSSGGQGAGGGGGGGEGGRVCQEGRVLVCIHFPAGAEVPITSYTCTQPDLAGFNDQGWCTVSGGLRTCVITEGSSPDSNIGGTYVWNGNTNPFVVLEVPQGWCIESVKMMFIASSIPTLSLSVHSAERLSNNTDRTMFTLASEAGTTPVVMNLTTLAGGKYLRINMTSTGRLYLNEIEVYGKSRYTFTDTRNLHDMLTPLLTSLNLSSVTDDSICTHPSSAGGDPASPTTSVTAIRKYTKYSTEVSIHLYIQWHLYVYLNMHSLVTLAVVAYSAVYNAHVYCEYSSYYIAISTGTYVHLTIHFTMHYLVVVYSAVFVLPPSHHHLPSLHVAGVGNDGL